MSDVNQHIYGTRDGMPAEGVNPMGMMLATSQRGHVMKSIGGLEAYAWSVVVIGEEDHLGAGIAFSLGAAELEANTVARNYMRGTS